MLFLPDSMKQVRSDVFERCKIALLRLPSEIGIRFFMTEKSGKREWIQLLRAARILERVPSICLFFSGSDYDFGEPAFIEVKKRLLSRKTA